MSSTTCMTPLPFELVLVSMPFSPLWCISCKGGIEVHHPHRHLPRRRLDRRGARAFRTHLFRGLTLSWPLITPLDHQRNLVLNAPPRPTSYGRLSSAPSLLGEIRYCKVWNQGFVRFLSINKLDHVIEEDFLVGVLTLDLQDDNKLVYYILEDALAGSALATKYLRRAALWNGHEAYYFLYDGCGRSQSVSSLKGCAANCRIKRSINGKLEGG